ncbi:MAG TPA: deiodinase family protein, partial [Urbifossiella sp.]|nr:deiodinase family protein [Urbifossiella sp.]
MLTRVLLAALLTTLAVATAPAADDPPNAPVTLPPLDPARYADPKAAAATADEVEKGYAGKAQPEAVKMLLAILRGSRMGAGDGWFGPARTRYTWDWLAGKHGLDAAAKGIPRA